MTIERLERLMVVLRDCEADFDATAFTTAASHYLYWMLKARRLDPRDDSGFREEAFERSLDELSEVLAFVLLAAQEAEVSFDDLLERATTGWEYRVERRPS